MREKTVLLCGDWHCGSRVGLTPPKWHCAGAGSANRRRVLWQWFSERVRRYGPYDGAIINGDSIDGSAGRNTTESLTTDRSEQRDMALAVAKFVGANKWWHTAGTPYHAGEQESWERELAQQLDAHYELEAHIDVNGLQVCARHFIGNSQSPASRYTALSNAQVKQTLWHLRGQQPRANLIVRSHIHRCLEISDPATNFRACTLPGLMGLGSRYAVTQMDALPVDFGVAVLKVRSREEWGIIYEIAPLTQQPASVQRL